MKVFLTGASGILGTDIARELELANCETVKFNSTDILLGDYHDVKTKVTDFNPDVVIHCAALTNVDLCEDDRKAALLTNVIGSKNLSLAADKVNAKIVYISSCGIYGNSRTSPYTELDRPKPVNYHHFTKLEGEKAVKAHNNQFLVIRPGWLFGGTIHHKKNFVEGRRKDAMSNAVLKSASDKVGSPTATADLAKQLMLMINEDIGGTFNVVNEGYASRFEYVKAIVEAFGFGTVVEPANSDMFPRKAIMPDNESLQNFNLALIGRDNMRNWKVALRDYITATYNL